MKRDQAYDTAVSNFQREHERWIQNAVVLFGVLISILLTYKSTGLLRRPIVLTLATVISAMAVLVSLTIRGSTDAWRDTVRHIEECNDDKDISPYAIFDEYLLWYTQSRGHWRDFLEVVCFWRRRWCRKVVFSVTRLYTLAAFAAALLFAIMFALDCLALARALHWRAPVAHSAVPPVSTELLRSLKASDLKQKDLQSLRAAAIDALHALSDHERGAEARAIEESESWLSSLQVQKGLLIVGVAYSIFALLQWRAIYGQGKIAQRALDIGERPYLRLSLSSWNNSDLSCQIAVTNTGRGFAFVTDSNWVFTITDSANRPSELPPYKPDSPTGRLGNATISSNRYKFISARPEFQPSDLGDFKAQRRFAHLFAFVDYRGPLGKDLYHTEIGVLVQLAPQGTSFRVEMICPPDHMYADDT